MPWLKCENCKSDVWVEYKIYQRTPFCRNCKNISAMLEQLKMAHWRHLDHSGATKSERAWE